MHAAGTVSRIHSCLYRRPAYSRRMTAPTGRALVNGQAAIESFSLSADGSLLVYALRRVVRGQYVSHLWAVPWIGGRPRRLTDGNVRDGSPAIAPDGRRVAFTRTPAGAAAAEPQIWLAPLDGATPRAWKLTRQRHGASSPRWSPDGRRLAFLGQGGPHRFLVGKEDPKRAPTARRMTRTDFRDDEAGYLSRRSHLWLIDARRGARARQLTSGDFDVAHPAWAPDGSWLAFSADMGADANISPRSQIFRTGLNGRPAAPLVSLAGDADRPAISPDGRWLAFIGTDVADPGDAVLTELWVAPLDGGKPHSLTGGLDRSVGCEGWADLVMADDEPGPVWLDDGAVLAMVADMARNLPYRIGLDGSASPLLEPDRLVGAGLAAAGRRVAMSAGVDRQAAELYALELGETGRSRLRRLTTHGSGWQRRFPLPDWEEHWIDGPGGKIQTWIVSPPGAAKGPLPAVFIFHGGPTGSSAPGGTMDSTMLAGHGYRVVLPNVRGSASFGSAWTAALGGRWGEVDAADVEAVAAALMARRLVRRGRIGMLGLSYGGYLVQWLAGHSQTFAAGVAENGVANQLSTWANSYFGVHYNRRAGLGDPLSEKGAQQLWSTSPLRLASRIRTPLLMLQAEEDRICPPADNEQLFTALKVLDREVEYILYPEEHHEMKNYGRPDRRIDRMERILAWFDRYLAADSGG
jgi:dipeptidyl aminopeptidase/acylaminoacyl peptidase